MIRFLLLFAWLFPGWAHAKFPPPLAPSSEQVDAIRVYKAQRKMELLRALFDVMPQDGPQERRLLLAGSIIRYMAELD